MSISRMLVTAGCAVVLLAGVPAAYAQRGGGGGFHGGGMGGFHGGGMGGFHGGGMGGFRGGAAGTMGHGPGPFVGSRGSAPIIRGGAPMIGGRTSFGRGDFNRGNFTVNRGGFDRGAGFDRRADFNRFHFRDGHFIDFHGHFNVGFGLWAGWPWLWGYPYSYSSDYDAYPYPYVSNDSDLYTGTSGVDVQSGQMNVGGLIFDVNPDSAELFVDGNPLGTVDRFTPTTQQPLALTPGGHHVRSALPDTTV